MRIAVLGCGSIGRRHLRNLAQLGFGDLLAYDPSPQACERAQSEGAAAAHTTLQPVWDAEPQVVFINAPTNLHLPLALEAAEKGCHLFIEKPLSHSLEGSQPLLDLVDQQRLISMVGANMRFHPGPAAVKELIMSGAVGEVLSARLQTGSYLPRWRPETDYRQSYSASVEWGGCTLDCIHELDLALWYSGPGVLRGAASLPARSLDLECEGLIEILLEHASGTLSSVQLNFIQQDYRRSCQIIGAAGTIYWDFSDGMVLLYGEDGALRRRLPQPPDWQINQMYLDEVAHFMNCVAENTPAANPLAEALETTHLALQARAMGREGWK